MGLGEILTSILPYLTPSEQAVYLRLWHLSGGIGSCAVRYVDLCRAAHVSRSTLKRTLKALAQKKLVRVAFQAKQASLFAVCERPLTPKGKSDLGFAKPRLYDFFSLEDRALFLSTKRSLAPAVTQEIEAEASDLYEVDVLIFRRYFGPDRQRKYAHLLEGVQNGP